MADLLLRAVGSLSTAATARMARDMPWFSGLSAEERSWVSLIVQSGLRGFSDWYRDGGPPVTELEVISQVFGEAPRTLTGTITLHQTVDLARLSIDVVEEHLDGIVPASDAMAVHTALSRYAREIAFATAEVYARAAEQRGAWDARLEALVVDSVMRSDSDQSLLSRASALGWSGRGGVVVVLGSAPVDRPEGGLFEGIRHHARHLDLEVLCAVQGERLVLVLGGVRDAEKVAQQVTEHFGAGPVVAGGPVPDLTRAHEAALDAVWGLQAAPAWVEAPRPVLADDLLPERVLCGDETARERLLAEVFHPVAESDTLLETLTNFFGAGGSIEGSARALFVHANTVRYRLRQVAELTGLSATDPREAFVLRVALVVGRTEP